MAQVLNHVHPHLPFRRLPIARAADKIGYIPLLGSCIGVVRLTCSSAAILGSISMIAYASLRVNHNKDKYQPMLKRWRFIYAHALFELKHGLYELVPGLSRPSRDYETIFRREMMRAFTQNLNLSADDKSTFERLYSGALQNTPLPSLKLSLEGLTTIVNASEHYNPRFPLAVDEMLFKVALNHDNNRLASILERRLEGTTVFRDWHAALELEDEFTEEEFRQFLRERLFVEAAVRPWSVQELCQLCKLKMPNLLQKVQNNVTSEQWLAVCLELRLPKWIKISPEHEAIISCIFEAIGEDTLYAEAEHLISYCFDTDRLELPALLCKRLLSSGNDEKNKQLIENILSIPNSFPYGNAFIKINQLCPALFNYAWRDDRIDLLKSVLNLLPPVCLPSTRSPTLFMGLMQKPLDMAIATKQYAVIKLLFTEMLNTHRADPQSSAEAYGLFSYFLDNADEDMISIILREIPGFLPAVCSTPLLPPRLLCKISSDAEFTRLQTIVKNSLTLTQFFDMVACCMSDSKYDKIALACIPMMTKEEVETLITVSVNTKCFTDDWNNGKIQIILALLNKLPSLRTTTSKNPVGQLMLLACVQNCTPVLSVFFAKNILLKDPDATAYAQAAVANQHPDLLQELIWRGLPPIRLRAWLRDLPIENKVSILGKKHGVEILSFNRIRFIKEQLTEWIAQAIARPDLPQAERYGFIEHCVELGGTVAASAVETASLNNDIEIVKVFLKRAKRDTILELIHVCPQFFTNLCQHAKQQGNFTNIAELLQIIASVDKTLLDELLWQLQNDNPNIASHRHQTPHIELINGAIRYLMQAGAQITLDVILSKPIASFCSVPYLKFLRLWGYPIDDQKLTQVLSFLQNFSTEFPLPLPPIPPTAPLLSTLCTLEKHGLVRQLLSQAHEAAIFRAMTAPDTGVAITRFLCQGKNAAMLPPLTKASIPLLEILIRYACQEGLPEAVDLILQHKLIQDSSAIWDAFLGNFALPNRPAILQVLVNHGININHSYLIIPDMDEDVDNEAVDLDHVCNTSITPFLLSCANALQEETLILSTSGGLCFPPGTPLFLTAEESTQLNKLCAAFGMALQQDPAFEQLRPLEKARTLSEAMGPLLGVWCYYDSLGVHAPERTEKIRSLLENLSALPATEYATIAKLNDLLRPLLSVFEQGRPERFHLPLALRRDELILTPEQLEMRPECILLLANSYYRKGTKVRLLESDLTLGIAGDAFGITRAFFTDMFKNIFDNSAGLSVGQNRLIHIPHGADIPVYRTKALPPGEVFASGLSLQDQDRVFTNIGYLLARCCRRFNMRQSMVIGKIFPTSYFALLQKLFALVPHVDCAAFHRPFTPEQTVQLYPVVRAFAEIYRSPVRQAQFCIASAADISTAQREIFYFLGRAPFLEISSQELAKIDTVTALLDYIANQPSAKKAHQSKEWQECLYVLGEIAEELDTSHPLIQQLREAPHDASNIEDVSKFVGRIDLERLPFHLVIDFTIQLAKLQATFPAEAYKHFIACRTPLINWITKQLPQTDNLQQALVQEEWGDVRYKILPALLMAKGMYEASAYNKSWTSLMALTPELLAEAIQGQPIGPKDLAQRILVEKAVLANPDNNVAAVIPVAPHIVRWLQECITEGTDAEAADLLFACTNLPAMTIQTYITLKRIESNRMEFHTCPMTIDVPNYPDTPEMKQRFIDRVKEAVALSKTKQALNLA